MSKYHELPKIVPSKRFLFELIFNGATLKKICELTGWSITYIRKKLKEYNLPTPLEFRKTTLREMWKYRIAVEYMRLNGIISISSKTPLSWESVTEILHDMGISTNLHLAPHVMKHRLETGWKPFPPHLQQVIEGEMLGDGTLALSSRSSFFYRLVNKNDIINAFENLQWFHWVDVEPDKLEEAISLFTQTRESLAHLQGAYFQLIMAPHAAKWIDYVADQFRGNGYYAKITPVLKNGKDGKKHPVIEVHSCSSLNLYIERLRWYGIVKGVPWDFELTPTSLLHWFIGDGSFTSEISFSTHGFHWNEVEFLACQLRQKMDVKASVRRHAYTDRPTNPNRSWMIILPVDHSSKTRFLDYLGMAPGFEVAERVFSWKFSKSVQKQDCV